METAQVLPQIKLVPIIICMLIVLCSGAFLSFLKTALACCRRARLRLFAEKGDKNYIRAMELKEKTGYYQASLRTGIIFLEILLGGLGSLLIFTVLRNGNSLNILTGIFFFIIVSLISSVIFFILAETIPRAAARSAPEKITAAFSGFIKIFPVFNFLLMALEKTAIKLISRITGLNSSPGMTEDELRIALLEGEKSGIVESRERTMVEGVFYLGDRPAGTFMTHRSEIIWLDPDDTPEKIMETIKETEQ